MKNPILIKKKEEELELIKEVYREHGRDYVFEETVMQSWNRSLVSKALGIPYRSLMKYLRQRREGHKMWI
jgi:hypothetical protein